MLPIDFITNLAPHYRERLWLALLRCQSYKIRFVFGEDASRIRNGDGTENFGFLRKFVISLLKQDTSRGSLKGKRKRAGWNTDFLEKLLFGPEI